MEAKHSPEKGVNSNLPTLGAGFPSAKPLVLYESDDLVAMGSEEIAIRSVLPQEIDTYDPFDGEVKVWQI